MLHDEFGGKIGYCYHEADCPEPGRYYRRCEPSAERVVAALEALFADPTSEVADGCGKCGVDHPPRVTCAEADAYMSGVTRYRPEGSTIDPRTGVLWGEERWR